MSAAPRASTLCRPRTFAAAFLGAIMQEAVKGSAKRLPGDVFRPTSRSFVQRYIACSSHACALYQHRRLLIRHNIDVSKQRNVQKARCRK